jgi:hypothetical protein
VWARLFSVSGCMCYEDTNSGTRQGILGRNRNADFVLVDL